MYIYICGASAVVYENRGTRCLFVFLLVCLECFVAHLLLLCAAALLDLA